MDKVSKAQWECFCCEASFDMWRVRRTDERAFDQGFLVVDKESAEGLRDYLNAQLRTPDELHMGGAAYALAITEPMPDDVAGLLREELDKRTKLIRSDVFEVLRRHNVSEQCFAEVAMVTQDYLSALASRGQA